MTLAEARQAKTTSTPAQRPTMAPVTAGTRDLAWRCANAGCCWFEGWRRTAHAIWRHDSMPPKDQTPIPDFMRRNQFKDGGEVPGEGEGDKVPALYGPANSWSPTTCSTTCRACAASCTNAEGMPKNAARQLRKRMRRRTVAVMNKHKTGKMTGHSGWMTALGVCAAIVGIALGLILR